VHVADLQLTYPSGCYFCSPADAWRGAERAATLEFYGKDGKVMIRANGLELMNGFCNESETILGAIAAILAPSVEPFQALDLNLHPNRSGRHRLNFTR
jgi:hypothetical protein